ncbi:hypothetical protein AB0N99_30450 [Streptomyces sp. NPDC093272]|uniref:hypothetical protein n=1 Tax=Streptomyces sp. NPDC093272 TaxID=3154981 RepID=UPI0034365442
MNADQFNANYPVGSLVFAYPGFRPEDDAKATRLVTRTRTEAQLSASGHDVVWVEGHGAYISLTHVDPVTEEEWRAAKAADVTGKSWAAMDDRGIDEPSAAEEARARLFGFVQAGASEGDLPSFAAALDEYLAAEQAGSREEYAEMRRYAAQLEAAICQCEPQSEGGEYLHVADCPVAEIQMRMVHDTAEAAS